MARKRKTSRKEVFKPDKNGILRRPDGTLAPGQGTKFAKMTGGPKKAAAASAKVRAAKKGRNTALDVIDACLKKKGNLERLEEAIDRAIQEMPISFMKQILIPLIPKEQLIKMQSDTQSAAVRILFGDQQQKGEDDED